MRAVNPGLIVYSAHWLQCAAASPLYSIELPSILTVAPSKHVLGGVGGGGGSPRGAPRSLRHTRAVCVHIDRQTQRSKEPLVPLWPDATLCRVVIISWGMSDFIWRVGVCRRRAEGSSQISSKAASRLWRYLCVWVHTIIVTGIPWVFFPTRVCLFRIALKQKKLVNSCAAVEWASVI